ncbi:hypothetical protein ACP4OV_025394 [Aristida adscensionis]
MAQRDKKEEPTELRAPEMALCANRCGFPGNPATQNLCQSCFLAASASTSSLAPPAPAPASPTSSSASSSASASAAARVEAEPSPAAVERPASAAAAAEAKAPRAAAAVNRCSSCRRRVGLTGFRCRCGELFCGEHRYSDRHGCSYDYKAAARDAIARENPVVRAAKIVRF